MRSQVWIIGYLLSFVARSVVAGPPHAKRHASALAKKAHLARQAVVRDLIAYLNAMFGDHLFNNIERKSGRYKLEKLDVQSDWALAYIVPRIDQLVKVDKLMPDGLSFLLRKRHGKWHVLCMGTSLDDTAQFHVPQRLKERWELE